MDSVVVANLARPLLVLARLLSDPHNTAKIEDKSWDGSPNPKYHHLYRIYSIYGEVGQFSIIRLYLKWATPI